jgi:hypothetical protein
MYIREVEIQADINAFGCSIGDKLKEGAAIEVSADIHCQSNRVYLRYWHGE